MLGQESRSESIIATMSYSQKVFNKHETTIKGLLELIEVLQDIDENDQINSDNETTITDTNGDKITLSYSPKDHLLTVTKNGLKLTVKIDDKPKKIKVIKRFVLKD